MTAYALHMTNGKRISIVTAGTATLNLDALRSNTWLEVCTDRGKWCYINTANIAYIEGVKE